MIVERYPSSPRPSKEETRSIGWIAEERYPTLPSPSTVDAIPEELMNDPVARPTTVDVSSSGSTNELM